MNFKKFLLPLFVAVLTLSLSLFAFAAEATDVTGDVKLTVENIRKTRLTDGKIDTASSGKNVKIEIESEEPLGGIWLRYSAAPVGGYLDGETKIAENGFWSEFIPLEKNSATLTFEEVTICEINVFSKGELPSEVQCWKVAQNETDLMLFSAHSDDDQLFFAGLIPYYIARGDVDVKVCFLTTSYQDISRVQELLAGLWHCGLKNYPTILPMPDEYSESYNRANTLLKRNGYAEEDAMALVRDVLNTYAPSVVVLHDFDGEYGHGMHRYAAKVVVDTVENASETDFTPKKIYVHLLAQNEITLPIDTPIEARDGKSAFNISQEAFGFHKSQHWTWFYDWIYGDNREITAASQIRTYNPAKYGLYMSVVGADSGNDMLENIETHAARRAREEAEAAAAAEAEAKAAQVAAEAAAEETTYINHDEYYEHSEEPVESKKELNIRVFILPAIIILIIIATIFIIWVVEEDPFVRVEFPDDEM
ncbi:MAG: hypothetical protein E7598_00245 [Ruminococcaceae bacterium]|nr:hypothetical protein [Oscillospiraceae bacterium]